MVPLACACYMLTTIAYVCFRKRRFIAGFICLCLVFAYPLLDQARKMPDRHQAWVEKKEWKWWEEKLENDPGSINAYDAQSRLSEKTKSRLAAYLGRDKLAVMQQAGVYDFPLDGSPHKKIMKPEEQDVSDTTLLLLHSLGVDIRSYTPLSPFMSSFLYQLDPQSDGLVRNRTTSAAILIKMSNSTETLSDFELLAENEGLPREAIGILFNRFAPYWDKQQLSIEDRSYLEEGMAALVQNPETPEGVLTVLSGVERLSPVVLGDLLFVERLPQKAAGNLFRYYWDYANRRNPDIREQMTPEERSYYDKVEEAFISAARYSRSPVVLIRLSKTDDFAIMKMLRWNKPLPWDALRSQAAYFQGILWREKSSEEEFREAEDYFRQQR